MKMNTELLHGACHEWVLHNFINDDIIHVVTEFDYDIELDSLTHCFIERNGIFIDVRGEFYSFDETMFDEFDVTLQDIERFDNYTHEEYNNLIDFEYDIVKSLLGL